MILAGWLFNNVFLFNAYWCFFFFLCYVLWVVLWCLIWTFGILGIPPLWVREI